MKGAHKFYRLNVAIGYKQQECKLEPFAFQFGEQL